MLELKILTTNWLTTVIPLINQHSSDQSDCQIQQSWGYEGECLIFDVFYESIDYSDN